MEKYNDHGGEININSFRRYWLKKLDQVQNNRQYLTELECVRLRKRIHLMLQHLSQMEEASSEPQRFKSRAP
jgi:hypothetical protein